MRLSLCLPPILSHKWWKPGCAFNGSACWAVLTLHLPGAAERAETTRPSPTTPHFGLLRRGKRTGKLDEFAQVKQRKRGLATRELIPGDPCFQPSHP